MDEGMDMGNHEELGGGGLGGFAALGAHITDGAGLGASAGGVVGRTGAGFANQLDEGEWVEEDGGGREEAESGEAEVETKGAGGDTDEDSKEEEESGRKGGDMGGGETETKKADVEMNLLLGGGDDAAATEKKKEGKGVAPSSPASPVSPAKSKSKLSLWRKVAGVAKTGMLTNAIGSPVDELLPPSSPGKGKAARPRRPASGWRPQTIEFLEKCSLVVEVHSAMDVPIADASGT